MNIYLNLLKLTNKHENVTDNKKNYYNSFVICSIYLKKLKKIKIFNFVI